MRYCVVYNSTTKGRRSRLEARFKNKKKAEDETRRLNRTEGMGGFYSSHRCAAMGYEFRKEIGLDGASKKKRRK